jgi:hypothetical protein
MAKTENPNAGRERERESKHDKLCSGRRSEAKESKRKKASRRMPPVNVIKIYVVPVNKLLLPSLHHFCARRTTPISPLPPFRLRLVAFNETTHTHTGIVPKTKPQGATEKVLCQIDKGEQSAWWKKECAKRLELIQAARATPKVLFLA